MAFKSNKECYNKEYKLDKLVNINRSIIRDKTISNNKSFIDAISY